MSELGGVYYIHRCFSILASTNRIHNELSLLMIFDCIERVSDIGEVFETSKLHSLARKDFLDLTALIVYEEADLSFMNTANEIVL